ANAEPSLVAQRAYARARAALKERRGFDALRELRVAMRAAPQDAAVVKLMAEVQAAGGNTADAAVLLERAAVLDPNDATVWLELGRLALSRGDAEEATWLLARGAAALEESGREDAATRALVDYHLGASTARLGEAEVALAFYERYLDARPRSVAASGRGRMLALLEGVRWQTLSSVGDLRLRLGRPAEAVAAYEASVASVVAGEQPDAALLGRLTYGHLRNGDAPSAVSVAERALNEDRWREALALAGYVKSQGVQPDGLVASLRADYQERGGPSAYALALSHLLPRDAAVAMLRERVKTGADAADTSAEAAVVERWIALVVDGEAAAGSDEGRVRSALVVLDEALPSSAAGQRLVVARLIERAGASAVVETAVAMSREPGGAGGPVRLTEGVARATRGDLASARSALRRAAADERTEAVARVELAKLLLREGRWQAAWEALEPVSRVDDAQAGRLRVSLLRRLGRSDEALALLDEILRDGSGDASLFLERAELEASAGRWDDAERTLLEALNIDPKSEPTYAALFQLYEAASNELDDTTGRYQRLMRRMLGEVPGSRIARLKRAEWAEARREFGEADALLAELLSEDPGDVEALDLRMEVLRRSDRPAEATALIEARLAESPDSLPLLEMAQRHYSATTQRDKFLDVTERLLERLPPSPQRAEGLASVYLSRGRLDDAERVIREAMAARGEAATDDPGLALMLALVLQRQGDTPGAVTIKRQILETHPNHAPTANDLAYHFAVRGESLDEALRLATIAAAAEPGNSAYVDTLGWVYYKLGRFDEAAAELGRSLALARQEERRGQGDRSETRAVVSDHLGDAMYRLGRGEQAKRYWQMSMRLAPDGPGVFDPDLAGLKDRLTAKLEALEDGVAAPVAEAPGFPVEPPVDPEAIPDVPVEAVP
ncbi:MAG: tetratricopeptide repeat protein, partial [Planctomycetota bacterium]